MSIGIVRDESENAGEGIVHDLLPLSLTTMLRLLNPPPYHEILRSEPVGH